MAWAPDYVTTEELAAYVRVPDDADETEMGLAIAAASRSIDRACNRQFGNTETAEDRFYTAFYDRRARRWTVEVDDLMSTAGLVVSFDSDGTAAYADEIDDYALRDVNAQAKGVPWTRIVVLPTSSVQPTAMDAGVEVRAVFGWSAVPDAVRQACLFQASRFLARRDSPYGVAGSPDAGTEIRLLPKLDPDVALALRPFYRWWGAA